MLGTDNIRPAPSMPVDIGALAVVVELPVGGVKFAVGSDRLHALLSSYFITRRLLRLSSFLGGCGDTLEGQIVVTARVLGLGRHVTLFQAGTVVPDA